MNDDSRPASRVLFVEDQAAHAELAVHQLKRAGIECVWKRVETEASLIAALNDFRPTVVLSDFSLPQFDGMSALRTAQQHAPEIPFLFLSGTIGEERAVNALRSGAVDYVLKENMTRLAPAVARAMGDAEKNNERVRQESLIARLNRVLRMLSGVNSLVLRIHDRKELLQETCRLAVSVGGYASAIASTKVLNIAAMQPVAWSGIDDRITDDLRSYVADSAGRSGSAIAQVIRTGKEFVCNTTGSGAATVKLDALMVHAGLQSVVVLPLIIDGTVIAVLILSARDSNILGAEELEMLREVAGNLSFGLQYIQRDTTARFLSHFDSQTGLAKRSLFCERVQRLVGAPAGQSPRHAVVVMDVERLSIINDSYGRRTGDLVLQHVADRLKRHYPKTDQLAHFGGGAFALISPQGDRTEEEIQIAGHRQAEAIFAEPFQIEGRAIPVAVRTGFSLFPEDGADSTLLVQHAEAALHLARAKGDRHVRYNSKIRSVGVDQFAMEHRLRAALERQEFELFYQPKVSVVTRRIQGAEALIRWRTPEGLVSPAEFLPLLESTGLIIQVGAWVIRQAAQDCQRWLAAGLPPIRVAVNIAPAQLRHVDFVRDFLQAVESWATPVSGLDIEITEGVLQEDSVAEVKRLKLLRDAGVKIAIDDFGTGYSSLRRLAALPIDTLKIDRYFVSDCGSPAGGSLVKTIITLARTFSMTTVAEGVEKQEQLDLLWHLGCDQSQGFLHSPAVNVEEFEVLLRDGKGTLIHPAEAVSTPA